MKCKVSVILPSINPGNWANQFQQISKSCGDYSFEVIAVGPELPPQIFNTVANFRYIKEYSCPARSLQISSILAEGDYITWFPDDCIIGENTLSQCIKVLDKQPITDGMTLLYSEGSGYTGTQHLQPEYWIAKTHSDLRVEGVQDNWKIAPIFLYPTRLFRLMGGLDCRFEHINMNTHTLAFRVQKNGGILHTSPCKVFSTDWKPWSNTNKSPIQRAYEENDGPLFKTLYISNTESITNDIDIDNWRQADAIWKRRYET